uniref:Uncharacterized protein n=1 Tax=Moniliophthora roreri TaxID=221103 RepID=A0A0W0FEC9_MONRR
MNTLAKCNMQSNSTEVLRGDIKTERQLRTRTITEQSSSEVNIWIKVKAGDLLIKSSPVAKQYEIN